MPNAFQVQTGQIQWRDQILFNDFSYAFPAGQFTCILGPSGVGKSTLLKSIAGILPDHGNAIQAYQSDIAYMAQTDLLVPWKSLLNNVLMPFHLKGGVTPSRRKKAMGLLQQLGLSGYEHQKPSALSGGMAQRAALCRTLIQDKSLVLMDEPFSALDAVTRFQLQKLCKKTLSGKTVLMVTHDPLEALRLADLIIVLGGAPVQVQHEIQLETTDSIRETNAPLMRQYDDLMDVLSGGGGAIS